MTEQKPETRNKEIESVINICNSNRAQNPIRPIKIGGKEYYVVLKKQMQDTRESLIFNQPNIPRIPENNEHRENIAPENRPLPRFKAGDHLIRMQPPNFSRSTIIPESGRWEFIEGAWLLEYNLPESPLWDYEFGGWMCGLGYAGIHESNFILASERDLWDPHFDGLWSWWERKENENE